MPVSAPNPGADVVRIHKVITRGLAISIEYGQGDGPEQAQRDGYQRYVKALSGLVHGHHQGEDLIAFPFWNSKLPEGPFERLASEHRDMLPLLARIDAWLASGEAAWKGPALVGLQSALGALDQLWHPHISVEEATLGPENSAHLLSAEENTQLAAELAAHGQAHSQPAELVMAFIFYNLTSEDREAMMAVLPPVVSQELVPVVWRPAWEPMRPFLLP